MNNPIRQHIVPQSYLKKFSFSEKSPFYVHMQSKDSKSINNVNIANVAVVKNFYTLDKVEDNYAWEKFYANHIEPIMSNTLSEIIRISNLNVYCSEAKILSKSLKTELSYVFSYQMLRDQYAREYMKNILELTVGPTLNEAKEIFMYKGNLELDKLLESYQVSDHVLKLVMMEASTNLDKIKQYSKIFFDHTWMLFKIDDKNEFITSDHPLQIFNRNTLDATPFRNGIAQDSSCIYFPISPKILVALYPKNMYFGYIDKVDSTLTHINYKTESRFIKLQNELQKRYCYRQVYSRSKRMISNLKISKIK